MVVGTAVWRSGRWPRWVAISLLLALPIDIIAFIYLDSPFMTATVLANLIGWLLLMSKYQLVIESEAATTLAAE